jgi:hypothetical protein
VVVGGTDVGVRCAWRYLISDVRDAEDKDVEGRKVQGTGSITVVHTGPCAFQYYDSHDIGPPSGGLVHEEVEILLLLLAIEVWLTDPAVN